MINVLLKTINQKNRTMDYPKSKPVLPERFRGLPVIDPAKCSADCKRCIEVCPTGALKGELEIDLGRCLFCGKCLCVCPDGAINFSKEHRMAARARSDLVLKGSPLKLIESLNKESCRLFGRSFKLREVSAGGCNACEADTNVLSTVAYDLGRFGVQFVASPRHADGLFITGPVSRNMRLALEKTYEAVPAPKLVIVVGACAISGGPYIDHPEVCNGADPVLPVDLYIPGCPPHPVTILDGLLRLLNRL
jgi:Ni,Fe-hydrogenase III small subunit/NAD-dependent dihydropyrimidine dehydrogenase PreA subunit